MDVDKVSTSEFQAQQLAKKKRELETEENSLALEKARIIRERDKVAAAEHEKAAKEVVAISKQGARQVELTRKMNSDFVHSLNENNNKTHEALALKTAEEIKRIQGDSAKLIDDQRASSMEKVRFFTSQGEDPFYRIKTMNPTLTESDKEYSVKVALPEHEAQNLFISGEGQTLKLSLSRRFQDQLKDLEAQRTTKTSSYQTVVEFVEIPGAFDAKKIHREYENGLVTIHVPKAGLTSVDLPPMPSVES